MLAAIYKDYACTNQDWRSRSNWLSKIFAVLLGFFLPISVTGFGVCLILTFVCWILAGNYQAKWQMIKSNQLIWAAVLFFLILALSASYSTGTWLDISNALHKYGKVLYLIFLLPLFIEYKWQRAGINAFLLAMLITIALALLKMWGLVHIGNGGLGTIFTNHINTGYLVAFTAFIFAQRALVEPERRWLYLFLLALACFHLFFMNEGRTGYIVFAGLLLVLLWQQLRWQGLLAAIIAVPCLMLALFFVSPNFKDRISMVKTDIHHYHQQQLDANSIGLRLIFAKNSWELIKAHPLFGTGIGSFRVEYNRQFAAAPDFANLSHPQNEYLMLGVQEGILGLSLLLGLLYWQWRLSLKLPVEFRYLAQGLIVAFMLGAGCDTFLFLAIPGYSWVYFSAILFAHNREPSDLKTG